MTLESAARAFFDASPDALLVVDRGGFVVAANARAHALFGYQQGALLGEQVETFLPSHRADTHKKLRESFFAGERGALIRSAQLLEARLPSGEAIELEASISLTQIGGDTYAIASLREVSERERELLRARRQLQRDEALYRTIAETIPNALLGAFDLEMRVVAVEGALTFEGVPPRDQIIGQRIHDLASPDRRGLVFAACERCLAGERNEWTTERNGRFLDVKLVPMRAPTGEVTGGLGLVYDATDRERELARLSELSTELEGVLEMLPDAIVIRDSDMVLYANRALVRRLGYESIADVVDRRILSAVHPDDRAMVAERMAAVDAGASVGLIEVRYLARDGQVVPLENGQPTRVTYRGRPAWLLVLYDNHEERHTMLALAAQERMVTVGTLAAGVGHEINNPLTYVIGNLDLLIEEVQSLSHAVPQQRRAEILDLIAEARDGADRIRKIVRGLRTFARGEREERTRVDVHAAVEMALQLAQSALRHVTPVATDLLPTPRVLADESQLVQVLVNLLVNAAHALAPTPIERNLVHVRVWAEPGRALIEVSDNGPGMPPEVARRAFEPFYTTKGVRNGTGLGLSIVHNIVTGLGGTISLETSPGAGATFRVSLPAAAEA